MSKKVTLQMIEMHCPACAQRIEKILSRTHGIKEVSVSSVSKEVIIEVYLLSHEHLYS